MEVTVRAVGYTSWTDRILFAATILGIISLVSYKRKEEWEMERERERERESKKRKEDGCCLKEWQYCMHIA